MKVKTGGGCVDGEGRAYTMPEQEIEVPDDYFRAMSLDMNKWKPPEFIMVNPGIFRQLKKLFPKQRETHKSVRDNAPNYLALSFF